MKSVLIISLAALAGVATSSPIEKVVELITDLKATVQNDGKVEQQMYDKFACWCEKTSLRKANSINAGSTGLRSLGQQILTLKGTVATRTSEIQTLAESIADNKQSQAEATAIREKQNTAYAEETAEMKQAIAAMQKAVEVLAKGAGESTGFLQEGTESRAAVSAAVQAMPNFAKVDADKVSQLATFMQASATEKYAPQSATINGILKDMYETFSTDLEKATETESTRNTNFETYIAEKTTALKADEVEKATREGELAEAETQLADTTQTYDDTAAQKEADVAFFGETKASCESKSAAWNLRSEERTEELSGLSQALTILTSDDARELFASSIKPGKETGMDNSKATGSDAFDFLQVFSDAGVPVARAYKALRDGARKSHSLRLAAIAVDVRAAKAGHFEKVLRAIDNVIGELNAEGQADKEKRDECKDEFLSIESTVKDEQWNIKKNSAKIDKLRNLIQKRTDEKTETIAQIGDVNQTMADMKAQRLDENQRFHAAKTEDKNAIALLVSARQALTSYYQNRSIELGNMQGGVNDALLQQPEFAVSEDQAPEADFSGKGSHKGESKGVVQLLTMVIEDLDDEIKNGMSAEENAQLAFEKALKSAEELRSDLEEKKTNLASAIGKRTDEKDDENARKTVNEADLESEQDYHAKIKPDCDWIIGAFTERASRREAEMGGLVSAKEYLVGKQPSLLEETRPAFDDKKLSSIRFLGLRA